MIGLIVFNDGGIDAALINADSLGPAPQPLNGSKCRVKVPWFRGETKVSIGII
jgi:hypothetical protein